MPEYDNTNRIAIFKVDDKKNEKGPDYTGTVNIKGHEFRVSLWKRTAKSSGKMFLSGTVEKPQETAPAPAKKKEAPSDDPFGDDSDSIPF